ncbi:MAG: isochorismatase family protein [Candidatus Eisenbacteria bacterium]
MIRREDAILVVVDVQEKLLPHIAEAERVIGAIEKLIDGFRIVGAPVLVTEQYRKGLGPTTERLVVAATGGDPSGFSPIEKMTFGCVAHLPFRQALDASERRQVVLCGIEAHVCVLQTALQLLAIGFEVFLAADATSSRDLRNVRSRFAAWRAGGGSPHLGRDGGLRDAARERHAGIQGLSQRIR